jgi:hypothetical protein
MTVPTDSEDNEDYYAQEDITTVQRAWFGDRGWSVHFEGVRLDIEVAKFPAIIVRNLPESLNGLEQNETVNSRWMCAVMLWWYICEMVAKAKKTSSQYSIVGRYGGPILRGKQCKTLRSFHHPAVD